VPQYVSESDTTSPGTVAGIVLSLPESVGIHRAQILVNGRQFFAATDSLGRFRLVGVPSGHATILVRMIAYRPLEFPVELTADRGIRVRVGLVRSCAPIEVAPI
jgi:hypothetical protein